MLEITNDAGRTFRVTCVRKGERYGLNDCLVHDQDEPLVEFEDVTSLSKPAAEHLIVARYPARVILQKEAGDDLWLYGRTLIWRIGPHEIRKMQEWLRRCLETPKSTLTPDAERDVVVTGWTAARIPWPWCRRHGRGHPWLLVGPTFGQIVQQSTIRESGTH
jgi:hypothetical protein